MHQSIPPVPIPPPPGNPGAFVQVLCPGGGTFVHPGLTLTPREFDTRGFKTVKSLDRQDACYSFATEAFVRKVWVLGHSTWSVKD